MRKEFVPYNIALALKGLGFDEKCLADFMVFGDNESVNGRFGKTEPKLFTEGQERDLEFARKDSGYPFVYHVCNAPLYQQAFDWIRNNYGLWANIEHTAGYDDYYVEIEDHNWPRVYSKDSLRVTDSYKSYEEAREACLRNLIKFIKEN
jgi:hypothetical protein